MKSTSPSHTKLEPAGKKVASYSKYGSKPRSPLIEIEQRIIREHQYQLQREWDRLGDQANMVGIKKVHASCGKVRHAREMGEWKLKMKIKDELRRLGNEVKDTMKDDEPLMKTEDVEKKFIERLQPMPFGEKSFGELLDDRKNTLPNANMNANVPFQKGEQPDANSFMTLHSSTNYTGIPCRKTYPILQQVLCIPSVSNRYVPLYGGYDTISRSNLALSSEGVPSSLRTVSAHCNHSPDQGSLPRPSFWHPPSEDMMLGRRSSMPAINDVGTKVPVAASMLITGNLALQNQSCLDMGMARSSVGQCSTYAAASNRKPGDTSIRMMGKTMGRTLSPSGFRDFGFNEPSFEELQMFFENYHMRNSS